MTRGDDFADRNMAETHFMDFTDGNELINILTIIALQHGGSYVSTVSVPGWGV